MNRRKEEWIEDAAIEIERGNRVGAIKTVRHYLPNIALAARLIKKYMPVRGAEMTAAECQEAASQFLEDAL